MASEQQSDDIRRAKRAAVAAKLLEKRRAKAASTTVTTRVPRAIVPASRAAELQAAERRKSAEAALADWDPRR